MTSDGVVSCWGGGPDGSNELCFGDCNFIPHVMDTQARFQSIDAGGVVSCGVSTTEEAYCWGANDKGQRGSGVRDFCTAEGCEQRPLPVFGGLRWRSVSAGGFHACGITVTGKAYCWGSNSEGQLGADPSADMSGCDAECALKPELVFGQE